MQKALNLFSRESALETLIESGRNSSEQHQCEAAAKCERKKKNIDMIIIFTIIPSIKSEEMSVWDVNERLNYH